MKHMSIHVFVCACIFVYSTCAKVGERETRAKTEKAEPGGE